MSHLSDAQVEKAAREAYDAWLYDTSGQSPEKHFEAAIRAGAELAASMARVGRISGLTARQRDLLVFIQNYVDVHGHSPSFEDMRIGLGLTSKSAVHRLVSALDERGAIVRHRYRSRSINLLARAA